MIGSWGNLGEVGRGKGMDGHDANTVLLYYILEINLNKKETTKKEWGVGAEEMIQQLGVLSKPQ